MAEPDWIRIQELFHRATELKEPERTSFLARACEDNIEERRLVEKMLERDAGPLRLLDAEPGQLATLLIDAPDDLPQRVGPYVVDRLIGRGGMGVVVLAERPDLPRKVALKLLRDRWLGSDAIQRFKREQAVLARLQHPNIARLLNAGTADDGTPYLTIDYVDGEPVTEYCAARGCSIDEKLALMVDVCEAVRYAHQNLVVHRDLKPSNIFVDRQGHIKLLDFGIAKLLEDEQHDPNTVTSNRLMTPTYASPEQLAGQPVTTATDIYSLGVVLYELLTGKRPHDLEGRSATEALRVLTEEAPKRPSTMADSESDRRELKGDLDNVLLKALQRDPLARYASVEAMSADIQRHLKGFPVEAREATAAYRARKFVFRHKIGVAIAGGIAVLLVAFAAAIMIQRSETARERAHATREAARAERTADFLMGLFEANDPAQALGDTVSVRQLLDRGIEQAEALGDQPTLQAETYDVIGRVYRSLGQNDRAIDLLKRAAEIRRRDPGSVEEDLAATLRSLSETYASSGSIDEAVQSADEALEISRRISTPPSDDIAQGLNSLGIALTAAGRYAEADSVLQLSYDQMDALQAGDSKESIQVLANRLAVLQYEGRHDLAEEIGRGVLRWRRQNLPPNHPETAEAVDYLAVILRNLGKYDEAKPLYEEALAIKIAVFGPVHPSTAASILNLAIFHGSQGHYEQAEPYFKRAVDAYTAAYGAESPRTAFTMNMYAVLLNRTGRYEEAVVLMQRALAIQREKLGPTHPSTISTEVNLGGTLCNMGNFAQGVALLRQTAKRHLEALGEANPRYAEVLSILGLFESQAGDFAQGVEDAMKGLRITRNALGDDSQKTALRIGFLGRAMLAGDNYAGADSVLTEAYARYVRHGAADDPSAVAMTDAMGQVKTNLGEYAEADSLLRAAYRVRLDRLGPEHPWTQETAKHIRELYRAWGRAAPEL